MQVSLHVYEEGYIGVNKACRIKYTRVTFYHFQTSFTFKFTLIYFNLHYLKLCSNVIIVKEFFGNNFTVQNLHGVSS